jgi:hypothetical protein
MPARIHDTTLVVIFSNNNHEIERGVANSPDAAVGLAIRMLARRGDDLQAGDCLRVLAPH